jgi:hypothetical protein
LIEGANEELSYPIIDEFCERSATDCDAFATGFAPEAVRDAGTDNYSEGMVSFWTVDRAGGYTDEQLGELTGIVRN